MRKHNHFRDFTLPVALIFATNIVVNLYYGEIREKEPFESFLIYLAPFLTCIGVVFGLLGVITLYYLGKFHDLGKDSIKVQTEFDFLRKKLESLIELRNENNAINDDPDVKIMDENIEENWQILKTLIFLHSRKPHS